MSQHTSPDRRRFLGAAAVTLAAAPFAMSGALLAQSGDAKPGVGEVRPGTHTSFAALKQVEAGVLNVGYAEAGRADRRHRRGDLAAARQGAGVGQRLPDRQPAGQREAVAAIG